ncbi:lymphocyte-specific helicase-like isoform X2 [Watersipora subatra]|uniref:lymphocyte-specific helicase-like isoform X2 n=1 Tax=Watersipora subatra TaxID=2589382 RepID=UPI00355B0843
MRRKSQRKSTNTNKTFSDSLANRCKRVLGEHNERDFPSDGSQQCTISSSATDHTENSLAVVKPESYTSHTQLNGHKSAKTVDIIENVPCEQHESDAVSSSAAPNQAELESHSSTDRSAVVGTDDATALSASPLKAPCLETIISEVVSKQMEAEEEKLHKLNDEKEKEDTRIFLEEWQKEEEKEKEERYQKLQLLLTKSELYTKYLLERMDHQKSKMNQTQESQSNQPLAKKSRKSHKAENETSLSDSISSSQQSQVSNSDMALSSGCPLLFTGTLRPYQVDGLLWLNTMFENGVNGILADEMGLGKTIQCIAAIAHLITMDIKGPFLIVVPLSTLPNWVNEFHRFAPKVPVVLYHGSKDEREVLRRSIRKSTDIDGQWSSQPVVCTSYEVAMVDRQYLMSMHWKYLIVDEGHRIKNAQCRLIKELRLYDSTHRVLLTGTPLQNNLSELWSLLNFLLPEVFDDLDSFEYWFKLDCLKKDQQQQLIAEEKKRNVLAMLHKIMTPFILRRLKADVELNLPPKQELLVYAPLTQQQRTFYEATVNKTIMQLLKKKEEPSDEPTTVTESPGGKRSRRSTKPVNYLSQMETKEDEDDVGLDSWVEEIMDLTTNRTTGTPKVNKVKSHVHGVKLQNPMMQLRKCCSHPYLLSQPIDPETGYCKIDEEVVNSSGKMLLLDAMLAELKKRGHKVLIFSQMTKMLDLIEDYCHVRRHEYCRLDGQTDIHSRREQMELFNTDPTYFLFLLSTRAGGLGINLCAADTVIIFDSDWNPQCDLQAQDRAHRIGQTKPVVVYRLVCANTVDERVVERAARKRRLEKLVIHKEKFKTGMTKSYTDTCKSISSQELLDLLKSDDHDGVIEMNTRKEVISKRDLNALLDRSSLNEEWQATQAKGEDVKRKRVKKPTQLASKKSDLSRVFKVIDDKVSDDV